MSAQTETLAKLLFKFVEQSGDLEFHAQNPATAERWELLAKALSTILKTNPSCGCGQCSGVREFFKAISK